MLPKDQKVVSVTMPFASSGDDSTKGEIRVTLDDGSQFRSGGDIQSHEEDGTNVVRLNLTPIGDGHTDVIGPIVDDAVRALYLRVGVALDQPTTTTVTSSTSSAAGSITVLATPAAPAAPAAPAPTAAPDPAHVEHASRLHAALIGVERVVGLVANPGVVALLPAKYQGYALVLSAIEQMFAGGAAVAGPQG